MVSYQNILKRAYLNRAIHSQHHQSESNGGTLSVLTLKTTLIIKSYNNFIVIITVATKVVIWSLKFFSFCKSSLSAAKSNIISSTEGISRFGGLYTVCSFPFSCSRAATCLFRILKVEFQFFLMLCCKKQYIFSKLFQKFRHLLLFFIEYCLFIDAVQKQPELYNSLCENVVEPAICKILGKNRKHF